MDDIIILLRVFKTTIQMLNDRKYQVDLSLLDLSREEFIKKFGKENEIKIDLEKLQMNLSKIDNADDRINIYWFEDIKIDNSTATEYIKNLDKNKIQKGIIIIKNKNNITPTAKKIIQDPPIMDASKNRLIIDIFHYNELIINITEHSFVPKHTPLTKEQKLDLFKNFKENQLPKIQVVDPVAKYLGLQKGDVVKVEKINKYGDRYVSYRSII